MMLISVDLAYNIQNYQLQHRSYDKMQSLGDFFITWELVIGYQGIYLPSRYNSFFQGRSCGFIDVLRYHIISKFSSFLSIIYCTSKKWDLAKKLFACVPQISLIPRQRLLGRFTVAGWICFTSDPLILPYVLFNILSSLSLHLYYGSNGFILRFVQKMPSLFMSFTCNLETPFTYFVSFEGLLPSTGYLRIYLPRFCQVWLRLPLISVT